MRILIIEDEKNLSCALSEILVAQKYMVDTVNDGQDGYDYGRSGIYDCIILDVMLPHKDGFEICSLLRKEKISTPILMLTAKDSVSDKVQGLDCGADDYMTKPFSTEELLARVRTLTRRRGEVVFEELAFEDIAYSLSRNELICKSTKKTIRLTYKEAEMLKIFLSSPTSIISKEAFITKIWGYDSEAGDNNVEAYISFLRKKMRFVGSYVNIVSYKKIGYRLEKAND